MENGCRTEGRGYKEVFRAVELCISKYEFRIPTVAILSDETYELLTGTSLLNEPSSFGSLHNRAYLVDDFNCSIEIYRLSELSKRKRRKLEKFLQGMELPLILCKRGLFGFRKLDFFNLEKELAQT